MTSLFDKGDPDLLTRLQKMREIARGRVTIPPGLDETTFGTDNIGGGNDNVSGMVLGSKKEMHVQNSMVGASTIAGISGFLAQVAPPVSPQDMPKLTATMVIFALIPCISLVVRAAYCGYVRNLAHKEILALIGTGQIPEALANKIVDDASKISPDMAAIVVPPQSKSPTYASSHASVPPVVFDPPVAAKTPNPSPIIKP